MRFLDSVRVLAVLAVGIAGTSHAAVIGVNFGSQAVGSSETAGFVPSSGWLNGPGAHSVEGGSITVLASGATWSVDGTPGGTVGETQMFKSYLDGSNTFVDVSGLSTVSSMSGGFDVYVYVDAETYDFPRIASYTLTSATGSSTVFRADTQGPFGGTYSLADTTTFETAEFGNYIRFANVTGDFFTITGVGLNDIPRAPINGIQIVPVPEPVSVAALAVSGAMLLFRRRIA